MIFRFAWTSNVLSVQQIKIAWLLEGKNVSNKNASNVRETTTALLEIKNVTKILSVAVWIKMWAYVLQDSVAIWAEWHVINNVIQSRLLIQILVPAVVLGMPSAPHFKLVRAIVVFRQFIPSAALTNLVRIRPRYVFNLSLTMLEQVAIYFIIVCKVARLMKTVQNKADIYNLASNVSWVESTKDIVFSVWLTKTVSTAT